MDFTGFAAVELYRALEAEHDDTARRTNWLRELRDLDKRDREAKKRRHGLKAAGRQPTTSLTGAHRPWI